MRSIVVSYDKAVNSRSTGTEIFVGLEIEKSIGGAGVLFDGEYHIIGGGCVGKSGVVENITIILLIDEGEESGNSGG